MGFLFRQHRWLLSTSAVIGFLMIGCGGGARWHYAYDDGLRQAQRQDRDLLVFYKDSLDVRSGRMRDVLDSDGVSSLVSRKVLCMLVPSYAPNRAFVAQYGVNDAPALIVVHADGTYHAIEGEHGTASVQRFLEQSRGPGKRPNLNPRIPQGESIAFYNSFERAQEQARNQNRKLVIIYKWWLQGESTEMIRRINRPDVSRYFANSVNCILDWDYVPNREVVAGFGVATFPAIIIVERDGRSRSLSGLASVDEIIRFAAGKTRLNEESRATSVVWFADHDTAKLVSQRLSRPLVLYFASGGQTAGGEISRVLDSAAGRALLERTVNCRLEASKESDRIRAARYGVTGSPACIVVSPTGSFVVRSSLSSAAELVALLESVGEGAQP